MTQILVYIALALTLFLIVNLIGRHLITQGYRSIELLPREEDAPAFNAAIRVLTPTAYIILVAASQQTMS